MSTRVDGLAARGFIDLPPSAGSGGFDHAAVDHARRRLYVAHTANDAVDVIDLELGRHAFSVAGLKAVAGALVDEAGGRVFTSNRGEDTVAIFAAGETDAPTRIPAGAKPNGLAFDAGTNTLLCANVGDPASARSPSITLIDAGAGVARRTVPMPGRTRWAAFDSRRSRFFVNIMDPARIVVLDPRSPEAMTHFEVPARGPHGLDIDLDRGRLYCACDDGLLVGLDADSGRSLGTLELSGAPDVVFLDRALRHLYVAIGDPGVIDVVDVEAWQRIETVSTERGAHTIALDETAHRVYAFLPATHRAAVFEDRSRG